MAVWFWMLVNVLASVSLIFQTKFLFDTHHFGTTFALLAVHFLSTGLLTRVFMILGRHRPSQLVKPADLLLVNCSFIGSVVLLTLSLRINSVGFYQLMKITQTPAIALAETVLYRKRRTRWQNVSLVLICVGVATATVRDVVVNFTGFIVALASTAATVVHTLWLAQRQGQRKTPADQFEFVSLQTLSSGVILCPLAWAIDRDQVVKAARDVTLVALILFSGAVAWLVNLSGSLVIGRTSALTFNVSAHAKTVCVVVISFVLRDKEPILSSVAGSALAVGGLIMYSTPTLLARQASRTSYVKGS
mmetsp:Transcript_7154/g.12210  ORF Transcript_7154/g.12210 Transcript_7154/m.12210 type:complete len:304 (-) Transcript_7154:45-956(-)